MSRKVEAVLSRPYARVLEREPAGGYSARVLEFPGCFSEGKTAEEAIRRLDEVLAEFIEIMAEDGRAIPEPLAETSYGGRISLRIPPAMHRKVAEVAAANGVSVNRWLSDAIAEAIGAARTRQPAPKALAADGLKRAI